MRIALNLKGMPYTAVPVHLVKDGGQHRSAAYRARNPQALVPAFELEDGTVLTQSLAIMEYLDEVQPESALLPADAIGRARVRALAQAIAWLLSDAASYMTGEIVMVDGGRMALNYTVPL